jgi:hypothetical protein
MINKCDFCEFEEVDETNQITHNIFICFSCINQYLKDEDMTIDDLIKLFTLPYKNK